MCGQENDTLWHRVWFCRNPQVVAARNRFANLTLQAEATRENADLLWVTRAIIDDPSDQLPTPNAKDLAVKEEILDVDAWNLGTDHLCAFSDGSCRQELSREMKRASWGLIFYDSVNKSDSRATSEPSQHACGIPARQVNLQAWRWPWKWRHETPASQWIAKLWPCVGTSRSRKQLAASQVYAGVFLSRPEAQCERSQTGQIASST